MAVAAVAALMVLCVGPAMANVVFFADDFEDYDVGGDLVDDIGVYTGESGHFIADNFAVSGTKSVGVTDDSLVFTPNFGPIDSGPLLATVDVAYGGGRIFRDSVRERPASEWPGTP